MLIPSKATALMQRLSQTFIRKAESVYVPEASATIYLNSSSSSISDFSYFPQMFGSLHKNINVPWVIATSIAIWFLFIHTPPFWLHRKLLRRDVLLAVHIIAAGSLYLSCVHNCLFTPSFTLLGKPSKFMHIWVGRTGLIAGIFSFSIGAFLAWTRLGLESVGGTTLGFALPITIGGIAQIFAQYNGYKAIRLYKSLKEEILIKTQASHEIHTSKDEQYILSMELDVLKLNQQKALGNHIGNMISLFVTACGIPAGIRIAELIGGKNDLVTVSSVIAVIVGFGFLASRYMKMMIPVARNENSNINPNEYGSTSIS